MKKIAAVLIIAMLLSVAAAAATGINLDAVFESDLGFTGGLEEQIAENEDVMTLSKRLIEKNRRSYEELAK